MTLDRTPGRRDLLTVAEVEQMLRDRIEPLARELLPNAQRDGHFLCVGSIHGEPGQSLKVNLDGPNKGLWTDFASAEGTGYLGGGALTLIKTVLFGGDVAAAVQWAKSWLGLDGLDPDRIEQRRVEARQSAEKDAAAAREAKDLKRRRAVALWMGAKPIAGTPAEFYLRGRGIELHADGLDRWPGSLRFCAEVWNREERVKMPAMLAMMVTPGGSHVATHRTYLVHDSRRGWVKMDSPNAKMVLGACGGSFIPIRKGAGGRSLRDAVAAVPGGEWMHMPEGIEDALTGAMARPALRIGAGYSLGNIGSIVWPEGLGGLCLWCDRDAAGSTATQLLEKVMARQQARGIKVRYVMPDPPFKDLNDWLRAGMRGREAVA